MDAIIPVLNSSPNNYLELRYAIRSIVKHLKVDRIVLVGGKPSWYNGVHVEHPDYVSVNKERNIFDKVKLGAQYASDPFYYCNDDHFLLKGFQGLHHKGKIKDLIKTRGNGSYTQSLKNTIAVFGPDIYDFDVHCPMIMSRKGINRIDSNLYKKPFGVVLKTTYTYTNAIQALGVYHADCKISVIPPKLTVPYFSTTDCCQNLSILQSYYPEKTNYENSSSNR